MLLAAECLILALSHDGLWVFANRILANRIFADRVLADWRRRHRGWLLARQIGGSGNTQHGDEPSRYDDDDLHANPLCCSPGTGRPSDAPIPLCLCETPASTIPPAGSITGGMAPDYLSPRLVEWFNVIGRIGTVVSGSDAGLRHEPTKAGGFQSEWQQGGPTSLLNNTGKANRAASVRRNYHIPECTVRSAASDSRS